MVDGLLDNRKIGLIIQARMQSTRLPGKVLLPLPFPHGVPVLDRIIFQLQKLSFSKTIVVATSINEENDILEKFCFNRKIYCYRGSEENVLGRFETIQQEFNFNHIIRLTGDNPLIDLSCLEQILSWHIKQENDYSSTKGMPVGMNFEVFRGNALLNSVSLATSAYDKEHVTPVMKRNPVFKTGCLDVGYESESIRVTIDSAVDFLTVNALINVADSAGLQGMELIQFVKRTYPWVFEGNKDMYQKNSSSNMHDELEQAKKILIKLSFNNAAEKLSSR